ncbi:MAG: DUF4062 domain-containing protein, partial [Anaerolineae bacterium]|nr:DUF4062 domain-containing protein [Anaerolineae bacterium]
MTKIFIGSTSKDLYEYRQAAIAICNKLQLPMVAMEHFPAMSKDAIAGSLKKVEEADVYVGIFAFRYGYIAEGYEKSVTEMEFDHAEKLKLPRLCFLAEEAGWPPEKYESENLDKMLAFRQRIDRSLIRATFTTPDNFAVALMHALIEELGLRQAGAASAVLVMRAAAIPGKTNNFRGRTALIQEVQTALAAQSSVLLQGFGGMGKT